MHEVLKNLAYAVAGGLCGALACVLALSGLVSFIWLFARLFGKRWEWMTIFACFFGFSPR
jgi:hypothetical protein